MSEFAIAEITPGKLNALVKNLMNQMDIRDPAEAVRRFNSGEWGVHCLVRLWREENGIIYFSVTSDGTTGLQWIKRLGKKGFRVSNRAESVLRSPGFKPTNGVTTEVAILKGSIFSDDTRSTKNVRDEASYRKLTKPNAEVACLIREKFTDEEIKAMGPWWIIVMHEAITDSNGNPFLFNVERGGNGRKLGADYDKPDIDRWHRENSFAFAVSPEGGKPCLPEE